MTGSRILVLHLMYLDLCWQFFIHTYLIIRSLIYLPLKSKSPAGFAMLIELDSSKVGDKLVTVLSEVMCARESRKIQESAEGKQSRRNWS
jgi:hypothetical protein